MSNRGLWGWGVAALLAGTLAAGSIGCARRQPAPLPVVAELPAQSFARQWSLDLDLARHRFEWVREAGDYLIAFSTERRAYVIARATGRLVTVHDIRGPGEVLAPFTNGELFCYPLSTQIEIHGPDGRFVRQINLGVAAQTSGSASDRMIYIGVAGLHGGRLRAVDLTRVWDTPSWEVLATGPIVGAPRYFDQAVFFATADGKVYAVNENREALWGMEGGFFRAGPLVAELTVAESGVYVASTDSRLISLDRASGRVQWQFFAGEPLYAPAVAGRDHVFLSLRGQGLAAIHKTEGSFNRRPSWINREALMFLGEDDRHVFVRLRGNAIGALDKATGEVRFRSGRSDLDFFVANTGDDGLLFGATAAGFIVGIRPVTAPGTVGELMFVQSPGR